MLGSEAMARAICLQLPKWSGSRSVDIEWLGVRAPCGSRNPRWTAAVSLGKGFSLEHRILRLAMQLLDA